MLTRKSLLLTSKSEMLMRKSLLLTSKSEMLMRKSLLLTSKSEMLTRKSLFLISKSDYYKPEFLAKVAQLEANDHRRPHVIRRTLETSSRYPRRGRAGQAWQHDSLLRQPGEHVIPDYP